jgi:hypothetical protein
MFSGLCLLIAASCSAENSTGEDGTFAFSARGGDGVKATGQQGGALGGGGSVATTITNSGGNGSVVITPNTTRDDVCAEVHVQASRVKPWILFVLDRSGSTREEYPGSTSKWQAMYDTLMAPNTGVIYKLQSVAFFGMLLFDGGDEVNDVLCIIFGNCPDAGSSGCPRLITVKPALNNYDAINAEYSQAPPGSSTPSALALEAAYKLVPTQQQALDEKISGPQVVIFCTDGQPNTCENGSATDDPAARQAVIGHVTTAATTGVKTYVIGIAVNDAAQAHLDEVAKAGATGAGAFSPATKDDLASTISLIVGGAMGCTLELNNSVTPGKECSGRVELNSLPLTCNDPNGWKLVDATHIELLGSACNTFMTDATSIVNATFPCDALVIK